MVILLNNGYERVTTLARRWFDNFRPTLWTASDLSTGTATPILDSLFHELIALWVCFQYASSKELPNKNDFWNEILNKEALLIDWYGIRKYDVFTVTIASPGVFTIPDHGFQVDDLVSFVTSGALPTGLSVDTKYYVLSAGLDDDNFRVSATRERDAGTAINTSGSQSGTHWAYIQRQTRMLSGHYRRGDSNK